LKKSRLDITPGRKRAVGKTDGRILENSTPAKKTFICSDPFNFTHNDNAVRKIVKVKNRTSTGLPKMSAQLSDVSRTDRSQARTDAKGRKD
jgi:hypothetical protein